MAKTRIKRPRDPMALAKLIGDIATHQVVDEVEDGKNPAAVALGRLGGVKGGKARSQSLSAESRRLAAKHAAEARWKQKRGHG